ncbi:response regulator [Natronorarus salvus]|uniref:response regulator n=1 Tax=Natronorarus salvus TaxID=3117733 RepID=UPI002F26D0C9
MSVTPLLTRHDRCGPGYGGTEGVVTADVLLVEDDPGIARLVREAFSEVDVDATVRVIDDGTDALSALRSGPRPDLVLLDRDLPGTTGPAILAALDADSAIRRLPIIVLTGSDDDRDVAEAYDRGANAYVTKPEEFEGFVGLVSALDRFWLRYVRIPPDREPPKG